MSTGILIERAALLAAFLVFAACEREELPDLEFATECDGRGLIPCDLRDAECARTFFEYTACLRERENSLMPELRKIAPESMPTDPPLAAPVSEPMSRALALVELLETPFALRDGYLGHSALFHYSPPDRALLVADVDYPLLGFETMAMFIHEAVHAMQDAERDQAALERGLSSQDQRLALGAVLEGEAVFMGEMIRAAVFRTSIYRTDFRIPLSSEVQLMLTQEAGRPSPFATAPFAFSQELGRAYVGEAWFTGQQGAIDTLVQAPPPSTAAIMAGHTLPVQEARPLSLTLPPPEAGAELLESQALGRWFYELVLLRAAADRADDVTGAHEAGLAWDGDQFMVWRSAEGAVAAVWAIRTTNEAAAARARAIFAATPLGYQASRRFAAVGNYFVLIGLEDESRLDTWSAAVQEGLRD